MGGSIGLQARLAGTCLALLFSLGFPSTVRAEDGVTSDKILLGQAAAFSGPSAGLGVEMWRGAQAAFAAVNETGGVGGRRIELVLADDGYDAERALPAVRRLVEEQRVFALFGGVGTPTILKVLPYVLQRFNADGLFYFASFTGAQAQREPPYDKAVFNVRASYRQETELMVNAFVAKGRRRIGLFLQDDGYGQSGKDGVQRALKVHGLEPVVETSYPRGQAFAVSTAPQVQAMKSASVDAVIAVGSYQACAAFIRDARSASLDVPIHNLSFVGADQMLDLLRAEQKRSGRNLTAKLIVTQVVPSYLDPRVPAVAAYRSLMDRYAPGTPKGIGDGSYKPTGAYSFGSLEGYLSAKAFLAVLQATGRDLTRRRFCETAERMGRFELGLGAAAEFSPTRHQALDKVWTTYVTPGGWATSATAEGF
jgi:branched-chain amino acid transport system substrate-binding protein